VGNKPWRGQVEVSRTRTRGADRAGETGSSTIVFCATTARDKDGRVAVLGEAVVMLL
jgi:hypothetical protein